MKDRRSFDRMHAASSDRALAFPAFDLTGQAERPWWRRISSWRRVAGAAFARLETPGPRVVTLGGGLQAVTGAPGSDTRALFEALPARVASEQGLAPSALRIERVVVARGRSATCILSDGDRPRFVAKIPLSGRSLGRCEENLAVLTQVQACPRVPAEVALRIPRALGCFDVAGWRVFVETAVPGIPGSSGGRERRQVARRFALDFLTSLHATGREDTFMDEALFGERVGHYCDRLEAALPDPAHRAALRETRERLRSGLVGRRWPMVPEHGDFHLGNCLFDGNSGLTGVIDWDLGACPGMPVLDVLHALVTTEGTERLDGHTAAMLLRGGLPAEATAALLAYGSALGIDAGSLAVWSLVYVVVKLLVPAITRAGESRDRWVKAVVTPTLEQLRGTA